MPIAARRDEHTAASDALALCAAVATLVVGATVAVATADPVMRLHAIFLTIAGLIGAFIIFEAAFGGGASRAATVSGAATSEPIYNDGVVRAGVIATVFWACVGFSIGDILAWQMAFPALNFDLPWTNFGRLRPVHTSVVIFAFGGNALIATSLYVVQRTCRARLAGRWSPWFVFWGYQLFLLMAASGYLLGVTKGKEYAEPEWYADLWLTIVWVAYLLVYLGTIWRRKEPHIYVANWFFLSFIVTIAMLHIVNNLAIPISLTSTKSYVIYTGVQDAMTQWWYGHNAVGFFLTAGFLGMMYYFIPKRAERPIYSYRLSIVHFWSLIFLYIWAGPHHLEYTALPDWAQTLGMTFSIMLWMPSWGGMINGLMTLSGAWDKLRTDPVIRLMIVSVAFYGMSTFEGPVMSIKSVNSLSHYTDWGIGHVHSGAMGWVGMVTFGAVYCLTPWLWNRRGLYSIRLVEWHFWLATIGIVLYITSMWVAGITQGLMWRAYDSLGFLQYAFIESIEASHWPYIIRATGGVLFLLGALIMAYNIIQTIRGRESADIAEQPAIAAAPELRGALVAAE